VTFPIVGGIIAFALLKNRGSTTTTSGRDGDELVCVYPQIKMLREGSDTEYVCGLDPDYTPPRPNDDQFADMDEETWDAVYVAGERTVWAHGVLMGLLYDDGTDNRYYEYHYIIGNANHTTFVREADGTYGHIFNGMAKVYANEAAAIAEADRLNEPDDDGTSPVQPEGDDNGGGNTLPLRPPTGLGNGYTNMGSSGF